MSFGAIATDYDRLRPSPPRAAVRWLLPARREVAVDLAAGTGLLTRVLATEVSDVVAVEPDARMAAEQKARSPGVHVVSGRGEAIGKADAVLISSAWHWMDPTSWTGCARRSRPASTGAGAATCTSRTPPPSRTRGRRRSRLPGR
jgi:hypothetical protein